MGQTVDSGQILSLVASFALVIALLFATLWVLRRIGSSGLRSQGGRRLVIVDSLWLGNRQRIALVRADDREFLVGVSGQTISLIAEIGDRAATPAAGSVGDSTDAAGTPSVVTRPAASPQDRGRFIDAMRGILSRDADKGPR